jgi:hypothetical protein
MKRKKVPGLSIIFLLCSNTLCPQEVEGAFLRYDSLNPQINVLPSRMADDGERVILLYTKSSYNKYGEAIFYEPKTNRFAIRPIPMMNASELFSQSFWDPHTRTNYSFLDDLRSLHGHSRAGWYRLMLKNGALEVSPQSDDRLWVRNGPPYLQIGSSRYFRIKYEILNREWQIRKATMTIYDGASKDAVKEYSSAGDSGTGFDGNFFWISDGWFLKAQDFFIALPRNFETPKPNGSIFNYITDEEVSFAPEWIIGYGRGVVLTSTLTEKIFTGITVYTPDKKILYRDEKFELSGILNRIDGIPSTARPVIDMGYFDYPYIYCCIGRSFDTHIPLFVLIMNLATGETYISPRTYQFLGVFDKNE